ncbi:MAG: ROK family protein [Bacteroidales bacterium]|nr:ROK family protein [Bacteroidales bacterium]
MGNFLVGVDIGGTITKIGLVHEDGTLIGLRKIKTRDYLDLMDFIEAIHISLESVFQEVGIKSVQVRGLGIGAPNGNPKTGCIHHAANLPWSGEIPLAKILEQETGIPSFLDNDANVAAIAERKYGGASGMEDFAVITVGTGLGSGIFSQGRLLTGSTGMAGELGHTILYPGGRICTCGKRGCVETYVSSRGFLETYGELCQNKPFNTTPEEVVLRMKNGDSIAQKAVERMSYDLGIALANLVNILSLEAIFLTGGLMTDGEYFLPHVVKSFSENVLSVFRDTCKILLSPLCHKESGVLGGAALVLQTL